MKFYRRVWHRGYADWAWQIRSSSSSIVISSGTKPTRAEAVKRAEEEIADLRVEHNARWVEVPA